MRTIKFRAKAMSGEWVYGNFIHSKRFAGCSNEYRIHEPETGMEHDVLPETVGQFAGLLDKNVKEIYEGDVIDSYTFYGCVLFANGMFTVSSSENVNFFELQQPLASYGTEFIEVIGNIYETPELLTI